MTHETGTPLGSDPLDALRRRLEARGGDSERYVVVEEVGQGGMGIVYRVRDTILGRDIAMKVTRRGGTPAPPASASKLSRFLAEAQVAGQLDHPGIVPVHDVGIDPAGAAYITMKMVEGVALDIVYRRASKGEDGWSTTRVVAVLLRVCEAMAFAHARGVVHRDLKPSNIMIGRFGEVYVTDWGLARVLDSEAASTVRSRRVAESTGDPLATLDGEVVGTPAYMSPEQATGDIAAVGPRSDVYAVGAMLFQLLSGDPPSPVSPGEAQPDSSTIEARLLSRGAVVPLELAAIAAKAMAPDPVGRYADMESLGEDLRAWLEGRVVAAYETGAWAALRKWVVRHRALAVALFAAVASLTVGLFVALRYRDIAVARAEDLAAETKRALSSEAEARRRADEVLWLSTAADVRELLRDAESLWPLSVAMLPKLDAWTERARVLVDGGAGPSGRPSREEHRARLAALRARALPPTPELLEEDRRSKREFAAWTSVDAKWRWHRRMLGFDPWPSESDVRATLADALAIRDGIRLHDRAWPLVTRDPAKFVPGREIEGLILVREALSKTELASNRAVMSDTLAWAAFRTGRFEEAAAASLRAVELSRPEDKSAHEGSRKDLLAKIASWSDPAARREREAEERALAEEVARLSVVVDVRTRFAFADPRESWWHGQLADLVEALDGLTDVARGGEFSTGVTPSKGWGVPKRAEFLRGVVANEARRREAWNALAPAFAAGGKYATPMPPPKEGLWPIGINPATGLFECEHEATRAAGEPPLSGSRADGVVDVRAGSGVVLTLLPGGITVIGSDGDERAARPAHPVRLSPFFIARHELTVAQWRRIAGADPSPYVHPERDLLPVTDVNWHEATTILGNYGLVLPTESQWEYACRAGTTTPWWTGSNLASLEGAAQVGLTDRSAWLGPRAITKSRPNPFGLHDTHGNVWEWCRDTAISYPGYPRDGDGLREPIQATGPVLRIMRGAAFDTDPMWSRSAFRGSVEPSRRSGGTGVRPACSADP